jgi:hypothetical protein
MSSDLSARTRTEGGADRFEPSLRSTIALSVKTVKLTIIGMTISIRIARHGLMGVMSTATQAGTRETAASEIGTRAINRKYK